MPPFRTGLKRKPDTEKGDNKISNKLVENDNYGIDEDLIRGVLDESKDEPDSEYEDDDSNAGSNQNIERVLYDNDADSTLDDEDNGLGSDESSDLTDSEEDDDGDEESDDGDEESDDESDDIEDGSDEDESLDSGAESGPGRPLSSDKLEKNIELKKEKVIDVKQTKIVANKKNISKLNKKESTNQKASSSIDQLAEKIKESNISIKPVEQKDEYESGDTSDEEDRRNTRGEVPAWWYQEYPHVGYDLDARRIMRPPQRDLIDDFLKKCEDPEFWRTVKDPNTGQDVRLSTADLTLLQRIKDSHIPDPNHDDYQPWVEWFSRSVLATPVRGFPEHKRSFLPSRDEQRAVGRLVHALKMGWAKTRAQVAAERKKKKEKNFYNLWGSGEAEETGRGVHRHIPAPRRPAPSHAESYNPPHEYLLDDKELKEWNKLSETPWKRKYTFLPQKFSNLRGVPAFDRFIRERFLRCLDLYLAPRAIKMRLTISPEELVPKLPSPRELQPFPTGEALRFSGHAAAVRSLDLDPAGLLLATGSDDDTVKVWEVATGRCVHTVAVGSGLGVVQVAWCPAAGLTLLAVATGQRLLLLNASHRLGDHRHATQTDDLLAHAPPEHASTMDPRTAACVQWEKVSEEEWALGIRLAIKHFRPIIHMSWHGRGDYLCATLGEGGARGVVVHQVSRRRSQLPLARLQGLPQAAVFHPRLPRLLVATQRAIRIYDLSKQELVRKLQAPAQWISSLCVHAQGDHVLAGAYDGRLLWWDLDLSARPYQSLRLHSKAVRSVAFHPRYPLFASAGDDPYIVVSHGMVYNDLLQNPLLVPLKQLSSGPARDSLHALQLRFHPAQPWLLAACADHCVRLYS